MQLLFYMSKVHLHVSSDSDCRNFYSGSQGELHSKCSFLLASDKVMLYSTVNANLMHFMIAINYIFSSLFLQVIAALACKGTLRLLVCFFSTTVLCGFLQFFCWSHGNCCFFFIEGGISALKRKKENGSNAAADFL